MVCRVLDAIAQVLFIIAGAGLFLWWWDMYA
jgi:hypothetical protein